MPINVYIYVYDAYVYKGPGIDVHEVIVNSLPLSREGGTERPRRHRENWSRITTRAKQGSSRMTQGGVSKGDPA